MSILDEHQFELLARPGDEDGFVFGIGSHVSLDDDGFDPGDDDWEDQDESNPRRGGRVFGRDTLNGPIWAFKLHTNRSDRDEALETLSAFKTAWRARHVRNEPGSMLALRYFLGGRYRRIFGRPGKSAAPPDNLILGGYVPITADFKCADGNTYDDEEQGILLSLQFGSEGGFEFPFTFPFTTLPVGSQAGNILVGGDTATYPVVRFNGPITNPALVNDDWTLSLDLEIADGDYVEVDLRPWALTALLNGEASVAGAIGARQYLSEMSFEPGPYSLTFRGSAPVSSATCEVRWANAYNSI